MFNRNEWIQWAQQSQKSNTEMSDFRNTYWRKNDATRSWMYESTTTGEGRSSRPSEDDPSRVHQDSSSEIAFRKRAKTRRGRTAIEIERENKTPGPGGVPSELKKQILAKTEKATKSKVERVGVPSEMEKNILANIKRSKVARLASRETVGTSETKDKATSTSKGPSSGVFHTSTRKGKTRSTDGIATKVRTSEPFLAGKQAAAWYATDRVLDAIHPGRRKEAEAARRTSPTRIGTPQSQERQEESVELGEEGMQSRHVKKQHASMERERLERKSRFPRQHVPGKTTLVVRNGKVMAIDKGEVKPDDMLASSVRYGGNDLQELAPLLALIPAVLAGIGKAAVGVGAKAVVGAGAKAVVGAGAKMALGQGARMAAQQVVKQGTKQVVKQGVKKSATQATKKTLGQKAQGMAGRVGTDVATYAAMDKVMGGGNQKPDTTAQLTKPNTIQQNTGPIAKIGPSKPQKRLAASVEYDGDELNEGLGKIVGGMLKKPFTKYPNRYTPAGSIRSIPHPKAGTRPIGNLAKQAVSPVTTALAFNYLAPRPKQDTTVNAQNPSGTAGEVTTSHSDTGIMNKGRRDR